MDSRIVTVLFLVLLSVAIEGGTSSREDRRETREIRRGVHYHSKRHMVSNEPEHKKRATTQRYRELRKKPSGHLAPLDEDDMDNDEVVSVAIGPPPIRPKYEKVNWKHPRKPTNDTTNYSATSLVKDVLTELGKEFLTRQVNEDFVFGQYIGNSMRNLTSELRLKMQHEILDVIVKYQRINRGDLIKKEDEKSTALLPSLRDLKDRKLSGTNETDENWPDFSNLAKIVG